MRSLLTPTIVIPIANYAMLSILDISFRTLTPLFLSTPMYLGGLDLAPSSIGLWLALLGVVDGLLQALFFAKIVDWIGPKRLFCVAVSCFAPAMLVFPIVSWLVHTRKIVDHAIAFALFGQLVLIVIWGLAFGAHYDDIDLLLRITSLYYRVYFHVYHGFCSGKECPWCYQWSWPDLRVGGSCHWTRLSDFAICIFKRT
jgi:hypothetical protein